MYADLELDFITTDSVYAGCVPFTTTFEDKSSILPEQAQYYWIFGTDTVSGIGLNQPVHIFIDSGVYDVKLIIHALDGSSRDTLLKPGLITAAAAPEANLHLLSTQTGCIPHNACFADSSTSYHYPIKEWLWDFGNGTTSTDQNPCGLYIESTIATINLIVTDSIGCQGHTNQEISFNLNAEYPSLDFGVDIPLGCDTNHQVQTINNSSGNGPLSCVWNFGSDPNHRDSSFLPQYTYTDTGTFNLTLKVTDSLGCSKSIFKKDYIKIRTLEANLNYLQTDSCNPFTIQFIDSSSFYTTTWNWNFGDNQSSDLINPIHEFSDTGTFYPKLTITDNYNCQDTITKKVVIYQTFFADFIEDTSINCSDSVSIQFISNSLNATSFTWNFGDLITSQEENPIIEFNTNGVYDVTLTVTDSNNCSHSKTIEHMVVHEHFDIDFNTSENNYCSPALLYNDLTNPTPVSWLWNFDNLESVSTQNFSYTFPDSGNYNVTLITFGNYCSDTLTKSILIDSTPNIYANFESDIQNSCDTPSSINFTNSSKNGHIYAWDFGDGNSITQQNPIHIYTEPGFYTVQLTIQDTNTNCYDTKTRFEYIKISRPFQPFLEHINCDSINQISLQDTNSHANSYLWQMGDGSIYNIPNITHKYSIDSIFNIQLNVTDTLTNCVSNQSISYNTKEINIDISTDSVACFNDSVQMMAFHENTDSFFWTIDDINSLDSSLNFNYKFQSIGTHSIILRGSNKYCTLSDTTFINILGAKAQFNLDLNCNEPTTITFIDSSQESTSQIWYFGDGDSSNLKQPIHSYETEGVYQVTLISSNDINSCIDSYTDSIAVSIPVADFSAEVTGNICFSSDSIKFIDHSNVAQSWSWNFGNGQTSQQKNPSATFNDTGSFDIQLVITTNGICNDTILKENFIQVDGPISNFKYTRDCNQPKVIHFKDTSKLATTYLWNFGDENTSTEKSPTHTYQEKGKYAVSLTASNAICAHTFIDTIIITQVSAEAQVDDSTVCFGESASFIDASSDAIKWKWRFSPTDSSLQQNPNFSFETIGKQNISLEITDTNGCSDTGFFENIVEILGPKADFEDVHNCINYNNVEFINNSTDGNTYFWNFGDGVISYDESPEHQYNAYGTYEVELKTSNNELGCVHTFKKNVFIFEPKADFTVSSQKSCEGVSVAFTDQSLFPVKWWWIAGSDSSSAQSPYFAFDSKGQYDVQLSYQDTNGCFDTLLLNNYIEVNKNPSVNFTSNITTGCMPIDIQFTDLSTSDTTITSWYWEFQNIASTNQQNPLQTIYHRPTNGGGPLDVRLIVENANGCSADTTIDNYLNVTFPFAYIKADQFYCINDSFQVQNKSRGYELEYVWQIGANNSEDESPFILLDSAGKFDLILIVTDINNCIDTLKYTDYITVDNPIANFTSPSQLEKFCPPMLVYFNDSSNSNFARYEWDYGDNTGIGLGKNTAHNYTQPGLFDVKLKVTSTGGCTDSITKSHFVQISGPHTDLVIVGENEGCKPLDICFEMQNTIDVDTFTIFYGDGTYGSNLCHTYRSNGEFIIPTMILEKTQNGQLCRHTISSLDTVKISNIRADFSIIGQAEACPPLAAKFVSNAVNANQLQWQFTDTDTNEYTNTEIDYVFENPGKYDITLIASDENDCSDTLTRPNAIDVLYINANFESNTDKGCSPFEVIFSQNCSSEVFIREYEWDFGNGITDNNPLDRTTLYQSDIDKSYYVSLSITDDNGCQATASDTIDLYLYPEVDFLVENTVLCPKVPLQFTNLSTPIDAIDTIEWDFEDDTTSAKYSPVYEFQQEGFHTISLSVTNTNGCTKRESKEDLIFVMDYPPLTVRNAEEIENGESIELNAEGAKRFSWTPTNSLNNPIIANPLAFPNETTVYYVTTTDDNGCKQTDSVTVLVLNPDTSTLIVPQAFTPNGDGVNDQIKVLMYDIERFEFKIYNKWGQLVFKTVSQEGWNGIFNGIAQPMGVYNYIVEGIDKDGNELLSKGQFLLIR